MVRVKHATERVQGTGDDPTSSLYLSNKVILFEVHVKLLFVHETKMYNDPTQTVIKERRDRVQMVGERGPKLVRERKPTLLLCTKRLRSNLPGLDTE